MKPIFLSRTGLRQRLAAIAIPAMLTAGCAAIAPQTDKTQTDATQAAGRIYQEATDLDGRLSVQYQQNGQDQSLHGSFTWRQSGQQTSVTLMSPLGQILATIEVGPYGATLTQSGHVSRTAADVDQLAAQSLGWPLPVSGLRSWLQGFAVDAQGRRFIAAPAANRVTTSDGWNIEYVTWDDRDPAHIRPKRIDLERQTEQAGDVVMRIVIDRSQTR